MQFDANSLVGFKKPNWKPKSLGLYFSTRYPWCLRQFLDIALINRQSRLVGWWANIDRFIFKI